MIKKIFFLLLLFAGLFLGSVVLAGCTVSQTSTDHGLFSTNTQTQVGPNGVQTTTKNCPFWNRDC